MTSKVQSSWIYTACTRSKIPVHLEEAQHIDLILLCKYFLLAGYTYSAYIRSQYRLFRCRALGVPRYDLKQECLYDMLANSVNLSFNFYLFLVNFFNSSFLSHYSVSFHIPCFFLLRLQFPPSPPNKKNQDRPRDISQLYAPRW